MDREIEELFNSDDDHANEQDSDVAGSNGDDSRHVTEDEENHSDADNSSNNAVYEDDEAGGDEDSDDIRRKRKALSKSDAPRRHRAPKFELPPDVDPELFGLRRSHRARQAPVRYY
ncbi:hypothetical protein HK405_003168, partial [Cladochytrium tenue]